MIYGEKLALYALEKSRKILDQLRRRFRRNDADLEDALQDAIEKLLIYGQTDCEVIANVDAFVWETTRRTALDAVLVQAALPERRWCPEADNVADRALSAEEMVKWSRRAQLVVQAARRLPKPLRKVLWFCKRQGLTYQETAERLNVSEAEVKNRLAKAVYRLKRNLETRSE